MGKKAWLVRRLAQVGFFLLGGKWLAVGFLRCPFAVPFISCTSCPLTDCPGRWLQPFYIAGLIISGLFTGRSFCGWACPMGFVQDALGAAPKPRATGWGTWYRHVDGVLKLLKWPALVLVLWAYWHFNLTDVRPYPYVVRSTHYLSLEPLKLAHALGNAAYAWRYVIFAVALLGALVVTRFWCRYLCPLGAILGLLNRVSLFKMGIKPETADNCPSCYACLQNCPMATTPSSTDCTWCTDCMNDCPEGGIIVGHRLQQLAGKPGEKPEEPEEPLVRPGQEEVELL